MKVYKVPHLSRKSTLRSRKRQACHAKRRGVHSTQDVAKLPPTSMKVYKVPHLSRKSTLRSRKRHACHAKRRGVHSTQDVAKLPPTSMKAYKVPHLSRKSTLRSRKRHACHAKRRGVHSTQDVAKLPPTSMKVYKVPHLSRKSTLRSRKCHACHAKRCGVHSTQDVAKLLPTSMKVYKVPHPSRKRHACHAKRRGVHSTQDVAKLPPTSMKVYKVSHLSRKACCCRMHVRVVVVVVVVDDDDEDEKEEEAGGWWVRGGWRRGAATKTKTPQHNGEKKCSSLESSLQKRSLALAVELVRNAAQLARLLPVAPLFWTAAATRALGLFSCYRMWSPSGLAKHFRWNIPYSRYQYIKIKTTPSTTTKNAWNNSSNGFPQRSCLCTFSSRLFTFNLSRKSQVVNPQPLQPAASEHAICEAHRATQHFPGGKPKDGDRKEMREKSIIHGLPGSTAIPGRLHKFWK